MELLQLNNLSIGYKHDNILISNVDVVINQAEFIVLLGKNGVGKTTLFKTIMQVIPNIKGEISWRNKAANQFSRNEWSKHVSFVFSRNTNFPVIKLYDLLALGRLPYHDRFNFKLNFNEKSKIDAVLKQLNLSHLKEKNIQNLSEGQLQLAMIGRALVQDTSVIFLDEPTSNLDLENQHMILSHLKQLKTDNGKSLVIATHDWPLVLPFADQLWWIENQKMISGNTEDIAWENQILEKLNFKDIYFDFESEKFMKKMPQNAKMVSVVGQDSSAYWLKQALRRHNIRIGESEVKIYCGKNGFEYNAQKYQNISALLRDILSNIE